MSDFKKYLSYPEMRMFWFFAIFALLVSVAGFFFLDPLAHALVFGVLVVVGAMIFGTSVRVARSALDLQLEQRRLQTIIADLNDGVVAYDNNFKMLVFNKAAEQIFNVKADRILQQSFTLQVKERLPAEYRLLLAVLFPALAPIVVRRSEPGIYPQVLDFTFTEPAVELRVSTSRILGDADESLGFIKIVRDRTREIGLLRSKSEFIEIASHQLRTPLTGIVWAWESLVNEELKPETHTLVVSGLQATKHLGDIIDDMLDVSRIEEGRFGYDFVSQDIVAFLQKIVDEASLAATKYQVKVYFDRPPEKNIAITFDPKKLAIAVSNLIDNALKYNVKNGEVVVKVESIPQEPYIKVSVRDTGIGIPEKDLPKLFAKFFRSDNASRFATEGTGLGIYITKNVVERHGGKIWVESELNRGTTFAFTLPIDPALIPVKERVYGE